MTCTGSEKKLYRSLDSLPAISNVKASLVLAQAEFDLSRFGIGGSVNIIKTIENGRVHLHKDDTVFGDKRGPDLPKLIIQNYSFDCACMLIFYDDFLITKALLIRAC